MSTQSPNNPAARFLDIINLRGSAPPGQPAANGFKKILHVDSNDVSALMTRLGQFMLLPAQIRDSIIQFPDLSHELYLKWLPPVENSFSKLNLQGQWKDFTAHYQPQVIYGLEICSDHLSRNSPERVAPESQVLHLQKKVEEALTELTNSELPRELAFFIYQHLSAVKNALWEYQISGIVPLEAEVDRFIGVAIRRPDIIKAAKGYSVGQKCLNIIYVLSLVVGIAAGSLQIGDYTFDALPSPGSIERQSSDDTEQQIIILRDDSPDEDDTNDPDTGPNTIEV